jgi:hypothetical protein
LIAVYILLIYGIFRLLRRLLLFKTIPLIHQEVVLRATCLDVMVCMIEVAPPAVVWFNGYHGSSTCSARCSFATHQSLKSVGACSHVRRSCLGSRFLEEHLIWNATRLGGISHVSLLLFLLV